MGQSLASSSPMKSNKIILGDLNLEKIVPIEFDSEELELMNIENEYLDRNDPNVFDMNNQSRMERDLPHELIMYIFSFMKGSDIIKLMGVSKNFAQYWTLQPAIWEGRIEQRKSQPNCLLKPMRANVHSALVDFHENFVPRIVGAIKSGQLVVGDQRKPKYGIVGTDSCGKSTWINRFCDRTFYQRLTFEYSDHYSMDLVKLPGLKRFVPYNIREIQDCSVFYFCFDVSSIESFNTCKQMIAYYEKIKAEKNIYEYLLDKHRFIGLVGMKHDNKKRKVTSRMVIEYLEEIIPEFYLYGGIDLIDCRIQYFEINSKSDSKEQIEFPFLYPLFVLKKVLPTQYSRILL